MSDDRREGGDRRQGADPSYDGPERRQGDRRGGAVLPPPWLSDLRDLIRRYNDAADAFDVFKLDAIHTPGGDDPAEQVSEEISDEMEQLNRDAGALLGAVPADELTAAYETTGGDGAEADAMLAEINRRGLSA